MGKYLFPCFASAGKGDSSDWELEFELSDDEVNRIKNLHAYKTDDIDEYPDIKDISDRLYKEMMDNEVENFVIDFHNGWLDTEEIIQKIPGMGNDTFTKEQILDYLEFRYSYGIRFPNELSSR